MIFGRALPPGWNATRLADVCHEITVGHVGPMADKYEDSGIPFLRSQNILPFRLDLTDIKFIPTDFHTKLKKSALAPGDVAIVRTGYPGTACVIPATLKVANCADLVIARPGEKLDPWFLAAVLNSSWGKSSVAGNLVGVAQQHFNVGAAKAMQIALPPLKQQRRISSILCAYDDLIENNSRRIVILEEMARGIYEEWFVRFRFPGHQDVRMVASDLGPVPEGWHVVPASAAIQVNPSTKVHKEGTKPFLAMNCLSNTSMVIEAPEYRAGNSGSKFRNGDTLFARITPCLENGKTGFVQFLPNDYATAFGSTEFIVLRSDKLTPEFVYLVARSNRFRDNAIKSMSGASGRQRVRAACFDSFLLAQPDPATLERFSVVIRPMFRLVHALARTNSKLRATHDLLLPKLTSGELDVSALPEPEAVAA